MTTAPRTAALAAAVLVTTLLPASTASGQPPESLRPGTNDWFLDVGVGAAVNIDGIGDQTKFVQELGVHLRGNAEGPALGIALAESVGSGFFMFQVGGKFWWDIQVVDDLGLYVTPFGQAGIALASGFGTSLFFNVQGGAQVKLIINDFWNVFIRPLAFDFFIGDGLGVRYDGIVGGILTF